MARRDRQTPTLPFRLTLAALAVIAVLIAGATSGVLPPRDSAPAATADRSALWDSAIPNLTGVKAAIVAYHTSGAWDADIYHAVRPAQEYLLEHAGEGGRRSSSTSTIRSSPTMTRSVPMTSAASSPS